MFSIPMRRRRWLTLLACGGALVALALSSGRAQAQTLNRLVGARERSFAIRDARVLSFDRNGQLRGTCADFTGRPGRAERRPRVSALETTDILRLAGLPDDDEQTPQAEEALADEGLLGGRRETSSAQPVIEPRALATNGESDDAWIATSSGLFRGRDGACRLAALERRELLLVAAGEGGVIAAGEGLLWRRPRGASAFEVAAGLVSVPRALAIGSDERAYVGDDEGVLEVSPRGGPVRIADAPTDALAVCGDVAVALTGRGVYRWSSGEIPARVADRPPVRAIACGGTAETRFIATGLGVWTSSDAVVWTARPEWLGRLVGGAATVGGTVWLAVEDRLVPLTSGADGRAAGNVPASPIPRAPSGVERPPASLSALGPLPLSRLRSSWFPWPRLTVLFAAQQTARRAGWSIEVAIAFPFGRAAVPRTDGPRLAAEIVARDARLAREEAAIVTAGSDDAAEQRAATLKLLRQEREALR